MKAKGVLAAAVGWMLATGMLTGCAWIESLRSRGGTADAKETNPVVIMETSEGTLKIELWPDKAPKTVANFLNYVDKGFYDGTVFHRVIDGFMIQGGGFAEGMSPKSTDAPVKNEASADVRNEIGTLAMARPGDIHGATSQFFINVANNPFLNHRDNTPAGFGYAVFGKVIEGMDVVNRIKSVPTGRSGNFDDVPVAPVIVKSVRRATAKPAGK